MRLTRALVASAFGIGVLIAACADAPKQKPTSPNGRDAANDGGGGGTGGGTGGVGSSGGIGGLDPGDASVDLAACTVCKPPGGQYCGRIGDGCRI